MRPVINLLAAVGVLMLVVTLTPLAEVWANWLTGKQWDSPAGDTLIVLGGDTPHADGNLLGYGSYWRSVAAVRAWRAARYRQVIVCGADGTAESIADYMSGQGVPREAIRLENRSRSTLENAQFASLLLREGGYGRVALLSSDLHMRRAVAVFQKAGFRKLVVLPSPDARKRCLNPFLRWPVCIELAVETVKLGWYRWKGYA
jgi:uncharacterized SAM-binding protein YcdF (DUF218 family)